MWETQAISLSFADSRSEEPGPTLTAVEPPAPENFHLYRAAVLAWQKAEIEERSRHADIKLSNPHVAEHAAARAVHELAPDMTFAQAHLLAQKATNWAAPAHHKWFWRGIPGTLY
jgi:hypothetical protein